MKKKLFCLRGICLSLLLLFSVVGCSPVGDPGTTEETFQQMQNMAIQAFQDVPLDEDIQTIYDFLVTQDCLVQRDYQLIVGENLWNNFYSQSQEGKVASIKVIHCGSSLENTGDLASLKLYFLHFDGSFYRLVEINMEENQTYDITSSRYLLHIEEERVDVNGNGYEAEFYLLTNNKKFTFEKWEKAYNQGKEPILDPDFYFFAVLSLRDY